MKTVNDKGKQLKNSIFGVPEVKGRRLYLGEINEGTGGWKEKSGNKKSGA